ncbi:MAG TPA: TIGR03085 family metal-binding protein [Acidimicrobiales bacterium]|nr:TIGR03085 family metal-binding protein [Acidimicrobiales bacterium]
MRSAELRKEGRRVGSSTHFAQAERRALCDLLLEVGPDAPTLCSGWTTSDLAAHLVVRERRPDALPGNVVSALAAHTEKVRVSARDHRGWDDLVALIRSGPPSPLRLVDEPFNTVEYFVHHEDVRRASTGWEPRAIEPEEDEALWGRLKVMGRLLTRRSPVGVAGESPGFGYMTMKAGSPLVALRGAPGELILAAFGRGSHADVEFEGDDLSIERLRHASLGV